MRYASDRYCRVPVLLAIDDMQALFQTSHYRNPAFERVEAYHLSLPRLVLEYASGRSVLVSLISNRSILRAYSPIIRISQAQGAFVGAVSNQSTEFPIPTELQDALSLKTRSSASTAWMKRNEVYTSFTEGLKPVPVPSRLNVSEAAALVEVCHRSEGLHSGSYI